MTTMTNIRDILVQAMVTAWTHNDVSVVYENKPVDLDRAGDRFIRFVVNFDDAVQANIAPDPFHRYHGRVEIQVFTKSGFGVRTTYTYLDELTTAFKCKVFGGKVHTTIPTPSRVEEHEGWHCAYFMVPFFADSNT